MPAEASKKDFQVWTTDGTIQAGFDNLDQATADQDRRNKEAEALGVKVRYEVRQK